MATLHLQQPGMTELSLCPVLDRCKSPQVRLRFREHFKTGLVHKKPFMRKSFRPCWIELRTVLWSFLVLLRRNKNFKRCQLTRGRFAGRGFRKHLILLFSPNHKYNLTLAMSERNSFPNQCFGGEKKPQENFKEWRREAGAVRCRNPCGRMDLRHGRADHVEVEVFASSQLCTLCYADLAVSDFSGEKLSSRAALKRDGAEQVTAVGRGDIGTQHWVHDGPFWVRALEPRQPTN